MQSLKQLSYQNLPPQFKVILGTIDITDTVESIENLNKSLDYVTVGSIRVGEVTVLVIDPEGAFAKDNPNNFFVQNSLNSDGQGVRVQVDIGYSTDTGDVLETQFIGNIIQMTRRGTDGIVVIEATDELHKLYTQKLTDFGIEKTFQLESPAVGEDAAETEENRNKQRVDQHGFYPVPDFLLPISEDSTTLKRTATDTLTEVPKVSGTGRPDSDNYEVDAKGIKLEGDFLTAGAGYPRLTMKAPYRYRDISDLLDIILSAADVHDRQILIPEIDIGENFASEGRVGYESVGTDPLDANMLAAWYGHPTDIFYESDTGDTYYLINSPVQDRVNRSRVIRKTSAGEWSTVFVAAAARTEFWKLTKHEDYLFVLATHTDVANRLPRIQTVSHKPRFEKSSTVKVQLSITGSPTRVAVTEGLEFQRFVNSPRAGEKFPVSFAKWEFDYSRGVLTLDGTFGDTVIEDLVLKIVAENVNGTVESDFVYDIGEVGDYTPITAKQLDDIPPDRINKTPEAGSYGAASDNNANHIFAIDLTADNRNALTVVNTDADLKPQLSHFLQIGTTTGNESFGYHFPDTRRSFVWHNNRLYYGYVNRNTSPIQFGVAKVGFASGVATTPEAVYTANSNGISDAGFDFYISGSQLVVTYIRQRRVTTVRVSA